MGGRATACIVGVGEVEEIKGRGSGRLKAKTETPGRRLTLMEVYVEGAARRTSGTSDGREWTALRQKSNNLFLKNY